MIKAILPVLQLALQQSVCFFEKSVDIFHRYNTDLPIHTYVSCRTFKKCSQCADLDVYIKIIPVIESKN